MAEADAAREAEEGSPWQSEVVKETPEIETFVTTYFEFPGTFTTNLKASVNSCRLDLVYLHNMMMKL